MEAHSFAKRNEWQLYYTSMLGRIRAEYTHLVELLKHD
jgi:hypothetical protein